MKKEVIEIINSKIRNKHNIDHSMVLDHLTLLITSYNRGEMLKSDLINGFKLSNQKKVIVDDCSIKQKEVISYLEKNKERFNIYNIIRHEENKGAAAARKSGFGNIATEYTMVLDDDDMIFCINKGQVSKKIERLSNDGIIVIPRYIINLHKDGSLQIGYDRARFNEVHAKSVLFDFANTGEIEAFLAGSISKNLNLTKYTPSEKFKTAEDYITLARMFENNLDKKVLVTEDLIHVRRIEQNSLSKITGNKGLALHLVSHLISCYYCFSNSIVNFNEMINLFSRRALLIEAKYGFGQEFSNILIGFIMNKVLDKELIDYLRKLNIYCENSLDELATEMNKMKGLNKNI